MVNGILWRFRTGAPWRDVARREGGDKEVLDVGLEAPAVDRAIHDAGVGDAVASQGGENRVSPSMPAYSSSMKGEAQITPARNPPIQSVATRL